MYTVAKLFFYSHHPCVHKPPGNKQILDDPLSAVDAHVGAHVVEHCLLKLLKGRTVLLATHALSVLPSCDRVVLMENGKMTAVAAAGEAKKLPALASLLDAYVVLNPLP